MSGGIVTNSESGMTVVAHLSDLHLLEDAWSSRRGMAKVRLAFLSAARRIDAEARKEKARRALQLAREANAAHVVVTGDLTEDGVPAQFEVFAELLSQSGLSPERVTLLAGNHDAYESGDAFVRALDGPLRPWARTSTPGVVIELEGATIVPMHSAVPQHWAWAAGSVSRSALEQVDRVATDAARAGRAVIAAVHHGPLGEGGSARNWTRGFAERAQMRALFGRHPHLHAIHGHMHRRIDVAVAEGERPRIFGTRAVVDAKGALRLYRIADGGVQPTK